MHTAVVWRHAVKLGYNSAHVGINLDRGQTNRIKTQSGSRTEVNVRYGHDDSETICARQWPFPVIYVGDQGKKWQAAYDFQLAFASKMWLHFART